MRCTYFFFYQLLWKNYRRVLSFCIHFPFLFLVKIIIYYTCKNWVMKRVSKPDCKILLSDAPLRFAFLFYGSHFNLYIYFWSSLFILDLKSKIQFHTGTSLPHMPLLESLGVHISNFSFFYPPGKEDRGPKATEKLLLGLRSDDQPSACISRLHGQTESSTFSSFLISPMSWF